jgi:hypothetical protein
MQSSASMVLTKSTKNQSKNLDGIGETLKTVESRKNARSLKMQIRFASKDVRCNIQ